MAMTSLRVAILLWSLGLMACHPNPHEDEPDMGLNTLGIGADGADVPDTASADVSEGTMDITMPGITPRVEDAYFCTAHKAPDVESYITQYEALASASTAHHMLLYACDLPYQTTSSWRCGAICGGRKQEKILFAWAKNAPPTSMPKDVGFQVGQQTGYKYFVLQIHYKNAFPAGTPPDTSGVRLSITRKRQKNLAGVYILLSTQLTIPPMATNIHAKISCKYNGNTDIHPFAFRVHAHSLGKVISGYQNNGTWNLIGKGNPQWPQAFYPVQKSVTVKPGDYLAAECTYDASHQAKATGIGATHNDEMCNFYMMYYTDAEKGESFFSCMDDAVPRLTQMLPADSDTPLPPNPLLAGIAGDDHTQGVRAVTGWPQLTEADDLDLGQAAGVATDSKGNVHVFHRGPRVWDGNSFNVKNEFAHPEEGPIKVDTVVTFSSDGKVIKQWGADMFYMPHGLHIDKSDNIWLTDVALHQVFKFGPGGTGSLLTLGKKLVPGSDHEHFCKPTDVATLSTGEFFVTDGYCNHRILKYSADGKILKEWGEASTSVGADKLSPPSTFDIPHSITALEPLGLVCVADRENGRVQCFSLDGVFRSQINDPRFNGRLFAVAFCPSSRMLYAVNGASVYDPDSPVTGFTMDPVTGKVIDVWAPPSLGFSRPHDIAISPIGDAAYVTEIGPNKVWKFELHLSGDSARAAGKHPVSEPVPEPAGGLHASVKKDGVGLTGPEAGAGAGARVAVAAVGLHPESVDHQGDGPVEQQLQRQTEEQADMGASMIIGALLIVPVIVVIAITVFLRLRKSAEKTKGYTKVTLEEEDEEDAFI